MLWMLHVSSLLLGARFQTIWHVSGHGPSPGEPEVGCELQAPCSAPWAGAAERCRCHTRGHLRPEDLLSGTAPFPSACQHLGTTSRPTRSHSFTSFLTARPAEVTAASPPSPPRHTWPQTQLGNGREPRHGAAAGDPRTQPRAEAASSSPSPSASNPAAVRPDGVFPLSRTDRALGAGRHQRRNTASGTGPAPSGVNARGGPGQDGGILSARGHRAPPP